MSAATQGRMVRHALGQKRSAGAKANKTFYAGTIVMLDASGYAVPGATATGALGAGIARLGGPDSLVSSAVDGDTQIEFDEGSYGLENAGDITNANRGQPCFVVDNVTVSLDSTSKSPAGIIDFVEGNQVYVKMSVRLSREIVNIAAALAS